MPERFLNDDGSPKPDSVEHILVAYDIKTRVGQTESNPGIREAASDATSSQATSVPPTVQVTDFPLARPTVSQAPRTQNSGLSALERLLRSPSSASLPTSSPGPLTPTPKEGATAARRQLERDLLAVDSELEKLVFLLVIVSDSF
ncbi:hypothetical protein OG21DRAFT_1500338 [Imleria badia]|nr:hypothetical protein OG21DRAFT_1500338 [Imleria badia]